MNIPPYVIVLVSVLVVGMAALAGVAAANEEPLSDGGFYWEGPTIVAEGFTDANEAEIYTRGGSHVENVSASAGEVRIDTEDLGEGRYYLTAPDADRVDFEIVRKDVDVSISSIRLMENPLRVEVEARIWTNFGNPELQVSANHIPDFANRVDGADERIDENLVLITDTSRTITVSLEGLDARSFTIYAEDTETEARGLTIFEIDAEVFPPLMEGDVSDGERGEAYWRPTVLVFDGADIGTTYDVETLGGSYVTSQVSTSQGNLYLATGELEAGIFRVLNEDGDELTRFSVKVQEISASVDAGELVIESNRAGYDAHVTVSNESGEVLALVLEDADETESVFLDVDELVPGEYEVNVTAIGANPVTTSFTVDESTPTPAETSTPTEDIAPTLTPEDTPDETEDTPEGTPEYTPDETEDDTPGFGALIGLIALIAAALLVTRRRP